MLGNEHFGRVRPHRHTSYAGLLFGLLVSGLLLVGASLTVSAAAPAVNPQSGSVGLIGTVRGPAPSVSATILSPSDGSHTSSIPVTVSGACPAGTFVTIEKNEVFAGATVCRDDGTFSLLVDLFAGANRLVARVSDALGQFGPDSPAVTVFYDAPSLDRTAGTVGKQLFLETSQTVLGGNPGEQIARTITIVGGVGPYAVSWDFGDYATSLSSQTGEGAVTARHTYAQPGTYQVIVRVTDSLGNTAYLQVVTVVNGPVEAYGASHGLGALPGALVTAWPLYGLAVVMVIFFWLGERRELRKLRRRHLLLER
ncbi:MAG TPA: PKD domain-containing protein [Candidatus Saccharimonadia bacterium]|nr:PKD domain-containing protein [Candidatus Saccharimonadia bacterium]